MDDDGERIVESIDHDLAVLVDEIEDAVDVVRFGVGMRSDKDERMSRDGPIELHLRVTARPGMRGELLNFLREAIPFYETPGGIEIVLLEDHVDPQRFIELIRYADRATYERDQQRVENDARMRRYLDRWRALLAAPPVVETYSPVTLKDGAIR